MTQLRSLRLATLTLTAAMFANLCHADKGDKVLGASPGVLELKIYSDPNSSTLPTKLAAKEIKFPLTVLEEDGDFLKVRLSSREVWLDGGEVSVSKPTTYGCEKYSSKPTMVGSTQGASSGCK